MKSMTGFGSADLSTGSGIKIHVDIASYNKKQLDVRVSIPNELASFEIALRRRVADRIARGALNLRIEIKPGDKTADSFITVNKELASSYVRNAQKLCRRLKLSGDVDINAVMSFPGVVTETPCGQLVSEDDLHTVLDSALDNLIAMRSVEGAELYKDIVTRLDCLSSILKKIIPLTSAVPEHQRERLMNNLKNAGLSVDSDDERVLKEIAIFTDKSDVSEEITRIESHFSQFAEIIADSAPIGRKMEFLVQELHREINTLGTKAAHTALSIHVVEFKTELEKIREQIQNVE